MIHSEARGHVVVLTIDRPERRNALERAWASDDLREGLAAFHDRRRPQFHGR